MTRTLTLVGVLMATGCAACGGTHAETPLPTEPRAVRVLAATTMQAQGGVRYSVGIQPLEQISIAFKSAGYVSDVVRRRGANGAMRSLQAGDRVAAGAVLARVRDADYREQVEQANSSLAEVNAGREKARLDLERARTLFDAEALTRPDLDAAQAAFDAAVARTAGGQARVRLAEITLGDTALTAPIDAVILERQVEPGSLVGIGTPGFVLGDVSSVKAIFGVPDSLVHRITLGQSLEVTTDAFPAVRFAGRVTGIAPSADPVSRVFDVELVIGNRDDRLKPGMIGSVEVPVAEGAPVVVAGTAAVPLSAVIRGASGGYAVFVVDATGNSPVVRQRDVLLGDVQGNTIAVTSGVRAGEQVVVMGATLLVDGESIRIIP